MWQSSIPIHHLIFSLEACALLISLSLYLWDELNSSISKLNFCETKQNFASIFVVRKETKRNFAYFCFAKKRNFRETGEAFVSLCVSRNFKKAKIKNPRPYKFSVQVQVHKLINVHMQVKVPDTRTVHGNFLASYLVSLKSFWADRCPPLRTHECLVGVLRSLSER
jgi:hypothetical protein